MKHPTKVLTAMSVDTPLKLEKTGTALTALLTAIFVRTATKPWKAKK